MAAMIELFYLRSKLTGLVSTEEGEMEIAETAQGYDAAGRIAEVSVDGIARGTEGERGRSLTLNSRKTKDKEQRNDRFKLPVP